MTQLKPTWRQLVKIEPRLKALLRDVQAVEDPGLLEARVIRLLVWPISQGIDGRGDVKKV